MLVCFCIYLQSIESSNVLIRHDGATLHLGFGVSIWYHTSLGRVMPLEKKGCRQRIAVF